MNCRFPITISLCLALGLCLTTPAHADKRGDKILGLLDTSMTQAKDQHYIQEMVTKVPGKEMIKQVMDVHIKGTKFRRVEFLEPGDIKGMRILILSQNNMYTYLPAYRKVRRVANHVKDQGFMGTTFSQNDVSTVTYSGSYSGKFIKESDKIWTIEAGRKEGMKTPYARIEIDVVKTHHQPSELRYFNDKDVKIKTEVRSGYECKGKVCAPKTLKLTDHRRNNVWTAITWTTWEVDTGVSDSFFSLRKLQRGR